MSISETRLEHVRVHDVMHTGVLMTDPTTPLRVVARLMAAQSVHAVAVADPDHARRPWAIVTALDVATAVAGGDELTAAAAATSEIHTVSASEPVEAAAKMMADQHVSHLIVVDPASGHPIGMLSALDVAAAYGG